MSLGCYQSRDSGAPSFRQPGWLHRLSDKVLCIQHAGSREQEQYITPLLEFWDGICCLFSLRKVPSAWTGVLLKALKAFPPETRLRAAADAQVHCCSECRSIRH